ncbi:MAG: hypothetical protein PHX62_00415, partial [Bacilli bacterium]|nr:hypothetical protein [Bacilli bacterium]
MNKYINIIIISFFSVLSISIRNIGYVFFIPIACFLSFSNKKNIFLIIASSMLSVVWFNYHYLFSLIIVLAFITAYLFIFSNKIYLINLLFIFLLSFGSLTFLLEGNEDLIINLLFSLISAATFSYFSYNMEGAASRQNRTRNFTYNEIIMAIISVIGGTTITVADVNLSIVVAMYFSMYFSKNQYPVHSVFFSLISMFFLMFVYKLEESLLIPFVSAFYMFPSIYAPVCLICFSLLGIISKIDIFPQRILEVTIGLSLLFEIIKGMVISKNSAENLIHNVYHRSIENINKEVISFASFLDLFSKKFSSTKEFTQKLSEGINSLTRNYCESCYVRPECYTKNKGKLYNYFKNMILYSKRSDYGRDDSELVNFSKNCPYIIEMRKSCILISDKLNLSGGATKSNALIAQLNGVSNVMRQFSIDNSLKTEMD